MRFGRSQRPYLTRIVELTMPTVISISSTKSVRTLRHAVQSSAGQALVICVLALAWSASLIGAQVFHANWGIVDDHEIFWFLGTEHSLPFKDIFPTLLTKTELAGPLLMQGRFRPIYYFLRVIETAFWGENVHLWYLSRVLMFATFIAGTYLATARLIGHAASLALSGYAATMTFWGDVWGRLGPAESYPAAALGVWLFSLIGMFQFQSRAFIRFSLLGLTLATLVLVGCKEPLMPFGAFSVAALAIWLWINGPRLPGIVALAACLLATAAVASVTLLQLSNRGADTYGRSISLGDRTPILLGALEETLWPVLAVCVLSLLMWNPMPTKWIRATSIFVASSAALMSLYVFEIVAYNGEWPTTIRYDFPGQLCVPAIFVGIVAYGSALDKLSPTTQGWRQLGLMVVLIALTEWAGPPASRIGLVQFEAVIRGNIVETSKFSDSLAEVVGEARAQPEWPIILDGFGYQSYEPMLSTATYLWHYEVEAPVVLRYHSLDADKTSPFAMSLAERLQRIAVEGEATEYRLAPFSAAQSLMDKGCISIGVNGDPDPRCFGRRLWQ